MNITITIPVHIDGPLTAAERRQLREHLEAALQKDALPGNAHTLFDPEPRMLGTICRFRFGKPEAKVE